MALSCRAAGICSSGARDQEILRGVCSSGEDENIQNLQN